MQQDIHQHGDAYNIRSVYFDDFWDSCMAENESGVDNRRKFRIRSYNPESEKMNLEIKEKYMGYTKKRSSVITRRECEQLLQGECIVPADMERPAVNILSVEMKSRLMRPKVIIDYERTAFVYPTGNVRVTFDKHITASRICGDFLEKDVSQSVPVLPSGMHILEVKYDELLPDTIAQLLETGNLRQTAFSKYYLGRLAVNGEFAY